eukprot:TRINITY_DN14596_c0_g2_i7.p1 TRINITY_DN14596_c0_g2~~TRINITY_DN14596_c0_g2_i7.p1  ORF type:complete len:514 (-),score=125.74 TRINITY_DN14596_c0_g2_i7:1060-2601(-)
MECPRCHTLYHKDKCTPLLLIKCGHTLCQCCASAAFTGKSIACPDCGCLSAVDAVSSLPKNMALLSMSQPALQVSMVEKEELVSAVCKVHEKKVEAFCLDDRVLLCIDCILIDGHKAHDIAPISKAYERELTTLKEKLKNAESLEENLITILSDINDCRIDANARADESREKITSLFSEIRAVIDERENALRQSVDDTLEKEEKMLDEIMSQIRNQLDCIAMFKSSASEMKSESECGLLERSSKREKLALEAMQSPPKMLQRQAFTDIKKDAELNTLWKLLKPPTAASGAVNKCVNKKKTKQKPYAACKKKVAKKKGEALLEVAASPKNDKRAKVPLIDLSKYCVTQNERNVCGAAGLQKNAEDLKGEAYDKAELAKTEPIDLHAESQIYTQQAVNNENVRSSMVNMNAVQSDCYKTTSFCSLKEKRERHKREQEVKENTEALQELSINNPMIDEVSIKELSPSMIKDTLPKPDCITPIRLDSYIDYDRINLQSLLKSTSQYIYAICTFSLTS